MINNKKYLYVMQCNEFVKFGVSNNPENRLKELQTGNPYKIKLLLKVKYDLCFKIEKRIHKYFGIKKESGEWFSIDLEISDFVKYLKNIEYNSL